MIVGRNDQILVTCTHDLMECDRNALSGIGSCAGGCHIHRSAHSGARSSLHELLDVNLGLVGKNDDGEIGVVAALVRTSFLVNAVYAESGREHGLTPQQGQLLCVLMAQPYGMGELGAVLGLAKSSLTGLVDRTERNGLVRREPDPADARAVRVALTERGAVLADEFYAETCRRIDRLPAGLSTAERDLLARLLGRIVTENKVPMVFLEV